MKLHQEGVDVLVNLLDAVDHVDALTLEETRHLLQAAANVLSALLERDLPVVEDERIIE